MNVEIGETTATFRAEPEHGRPVTFDVRPRRINAGTYPYTQRRDRFVVGLAGSNEQGFTTHVSFEAACASALRRATRYEKAYSVPRGVVAERSAA